MGNRTEQKLNHRASDEARICVFSQRFLQRQISACCEYEFEDVICDIDDVEVLSPRPSHLFEIRKRVSDQLARRAAIASFRRGTRKVQLDRDYDIFLAKFMFSRDLLSLNAVKWWRKRCRTAICWLAESWVKDLNNWKGYARLLSQFDFIILNCNQSVKPIQDLVDKPCFYVPPGIDAIKFCPYPDPPERSVYLYSIGRRSQVTHEALLKMAEEKNIFYIYDTIEKMKTSRPIEHRSLIANIAKRSRYFIVNSAKANQKWETGGQDEIGYRYFEGAAAGTIMIGSHPETDVYKEHFDWPDSVINTPFDCPDIADVLADLDSQPERIEKIRRDNIIQSLLRHDWLYRWKAILEIAGIEPHNCLAEREGRLSKLASEVENPENG